MELAGSPGQRRKSSRLFAKLKMSETTNTHHNPLLTRRSFSEGGYDACDFDVGAVGVRLTKI